MSLSWCGSKALLWRLDHGLVSDVFAEVDVAHVARSKELSVERQRSFESVGSLTAACRHPEIVVEELTVHRVCTIVDNGLGTLHRIESAHVGYALICDKDIHGVLGVVHMRYHRHYVGYLALLGDGRA